MKLSKYILIIPLVCGLAACEKDLLEQVNPNAPTTDTFWKTEADALKGINAAYAGIQNREITLWEIFMYDMRSDEGYSQSPWTELANVGRHIIPDYNIPFNRELWTELYRGIHRTNQVLANVPGIEMDAALKERILGEAKFLRGHLYYKLVTLWGRVPLVTEVQIPTDRPRQATEAEGWAQIEKDFREAKAVLPESYTGLDVGRATKGGATAYLGRALFQQKKYAAAAVEFEEILAQVPALYDLMPDYKDNFTDESFGTENNKESLFEIQFNAADKGGFPNYDVAGGDESSERAQFFGVRGIGWCDGQPTKWLLNEFLKENDMDGNPDPRLKYTMTYKESGDLLYGQTFDERGFGTNDRFWVKYTNYWKPTDSYFSGINTRVIRLADVYLMYAECLNDAGNTPLAVEYANKVRRRSNMNELPTTMTKDEFLTQLAHDRVVELAGESTRFLDLRRWGLLSTALAGPMDDWDLPPNEADFDTEFKTFSPGKEYLPIPLYEIDANPNLEQNPGW
jgi:tetratricopeptide (TPR) repeat protein